MTNFRQYIKNYYTQDKLQVITFFIYFVIIVLVATRFIVARDFPIQYFFGKNIEDSVFVNTAVNFENSRNTLSGVLYNRAYVIFLTMCINNKLYYSDCVTFMWLLAACSVFALIKLYKKKSIMSYIAFIFVLWHPIAFNYDIGLRLSRYNLIIPASLIVLSLALIYLTALVKGMSSFFIVVISILLSLGIVFYCFLIEDGKQIINIVIVLNILTLIYFCQDLLWHRNKVLKNLTKIFVKTFVVFIPLIVLWIFTMFYTLLNYRVYGVDVVNVKDTKVLQEKNYGITEKDYYDVEIIKNKENQNGIIQDIKNHKYVDDIDISRNYNLNINETCTVKRLKEFNDAILMLNKFNSGFVYYGEDEHLHSEDENKVYELLKLKKINNEIDIKNLNTYNLMINSIRLFYRVISKLIIVFTYIGFIYLIVKAILSLLYSPLKHSKAKNQFLKKCEKVFKLKNQITFPIIKSLTLLILPMTFFLCYLAMSNNLWINLVANMILNKEVNYSMFLQYGQEYLSIFIILFISIYNSIFYKENSCSKDFYNIVIDKNIKTNIRIKNLDRII